MRIVTAFCFVVVTTLSVSVYAQRIEPKPETKKQEIVIYRQDTTNQYFWKLKYNRTCVVKLKNVNRFVYKNTTSEQTGTNLFTEVPAIFNAIKLPSFSTKAFSKVHLDIDPTVKFMDDGVTLIDKGGKVFPAPDPCKCIEPDLLIQTNQGLRNLHDQLNSNLASVKDAGEAFNSLTEVSQGLVDLKEDVVSTWDQIKTKKQGILSKFQEAIHDKTDTSFLIGYKKLITGSEENLKLIEGVAEEFSKKLLATIEKCPSYDSTILLRALKCLDPCKSKKDSILYYANMEKLEVIRKCILKYINKIDTIKEDITKAKKVLEEMKTAEKEGKFLAVQKNYDLISEANYNYVVDEFLSDKDVHDIIIKVQADSPVPFDQPQNRVIKIKAITTGGIKVDFSTGPFISWGNNDFLGPEYYYKKIDSVNKQVIEAERSKKAMFSVGALAHFYIRSNCFFKPALSLGVSTTASFETVNLHTGISLLMGKPGKPSRMVLSFGMTLREVSLLDQRYQINTTYSDLPDVVPVSKNFPKPGCFFAITYNFFGATSK